MKFYFALILIFLVSLNLKLISSPKEERNHLPNFHDCDFEDFEDEDAQSTRFNYFRFNRILNDSTIPPGIYLYKQLKTFIGKNKNKLLSGETWTPLGPFWIDVPYDYYSTGNGRINCVKLVPGKPGKLFVGTAAGGLWTSDDYGASWKSIAFTDIISLGVSDISVSPSNPDIIYAALGDKASGELWNGYSFGIIKSTDGGESWSLTNAVDYDKNITYPKIEVDQDNPDVLTAASSVGLLRTSDGGINWDTLRSGFYQDFEYKPGNQQVIYASTYDVFGGGELVVSKDSGKSWSTLKKLDSVQRTEIGVTPAAPDNIYILTAKAPRSAAGGFYISRDGGNDWDTITTIYKGDPNELIDIVYAQGFYNLQVNISPNDTNEIYAGGIYLFKLNSQKEWDYAGEGMHVDQHALTFNTSDSSVYAANDGGIYRLKQGDSVWTNISKGLNIAQFYRIGINPDYAGMVWAGAQDMGAFKYHDGIWEHVFAGDGMQTIVDGNDPNTVYTTTPRGYLYRTTDGGMSWGKMYQTLGEFGWWNTPFVHGGKNPDTLLIGQVNIWRSINKGISWDRISGFDYSKQITALAISRKNTENITAARENIIYQSSDGGEIWRLIDTVKAFITSIVYDGNSDSTFWITCGRFTPDEKVLYYDGSKIINFTYNLPDIPVNCLLINKFNLPEPEIYIGTDIGVFKKSLTSTEWSLYDQGMPNVVINEFEVDTLGKKLYAATFSRGLWSLDLGTCPQNDYKPVISTDEGLNLCEGDNLTAVVSNPDSPYSYVWSNGKRGDTTVFTETGDFYVTAFSNDFCPVSTILKKIIFKVQPRINLLLLSRNPICPGDSAMLTFHVFPEGLRDSLNYLWSNGYTGDTLKTVLPGIYSVSGTSPNTCPAKSNDFEIETAKIYDSLKITRQDNKLVADIPQGVHNLRWYLNGLVDTTFEGDTIIPLSEGDYLFEILDSNYCDLFSETYGLYLQNFDGDKKNPIEISPNPFSDHLRITFFMQNDGEVSYSLFDAGGKLLKGAKSTNVKGLSSINVNNVDCAPGAYFLNLNIQGIEKTIKLIKIK